MDGVSLSLQRCDHWLLLHFLYPLLEKLSGKFRSPDSEPAWFSHDCVTSSGRDLNIWRGIQPPGMVGREGVLWGWRVVQRQGWYKEAQSVEEG